jgi:hypothetical protein
MACVSFSGGIAKDCENNIGGLTKVYLTDFDNITGITQSGGTVSSITMAAMTDFYEFEFNRNSATFTEDLVKSVEAGSALFEQTLTLTIPRRDVSKRNTLSLLTQRDLAVIIKDSNGLYWYPGQVEGMYLSESTSTSGTAKADGSNYVLTLKGFEQDRSSAVNSAIIAALIA